MPRSLTEALAELREDELVWSSPRVTCDQSMPLKAAEWEEYHIHVSQWELDRYLTMF